MAEASGGASRRDLLRGSAIGMGALVGALALTNLGETSADAFTGSSLKFLGGFSGINLKHKQPVQRGHAGLGSHEFHRRLAAPRLSSRAVLDAEGVVLCRAPDAGK